MKKFENATVEVLDINKTAMGPQNPNEADSEVYSVRDENGKLIGWEQTYGNDGYNSGNL